MREALYQRLILILFAAVALYAQAETLHVPADHTTIQAAIDAAYAGDLVLVAPGRYEENITLKSGVTVRGVDVYRCKLTASQGNVVYAAGAINPATALENFIVDGQGTSEAGIKLTDSEATIQNVVIRNARLGIRCADSSPEIYNTTLTDIAEHGIAYYAGCGGVLSSVTITRCRGDGIHCEGSVSAKIRNSRISGVSGVGLSWRGGGSSITPDLGTQTDYGLNSVHSNGSYDMDTENSDISAVGNWWGIEGGGNFRALGAKVLHSPGLTEPPDPPAGSTLDIPAVQVYQFQPDVGNHGQRVTITGEGFVEGISVTFGDVAATGIEMLSSEQMTVVAPSGNTGWVDVRIRPPEGRVMTVPKAFRYLDLDSYMAQVQLKQGINILSLPLNPAPSHTASSLAESLGSTIVIRAEDGQFEAYVQQGNLGTDFPIEMGKGYIVNLLEAKTFEVTGQPWGVPAAPAQSASEPWAFVMSGRVLGTLPPEASIRVTNQNSGHSLLRPITQDGEFVGAFVDMNQQAVVSSDDTLTFEVVDSHGQVLTRLPNQHLTAEHIVQAHLHTMFQASPHGTRLLPNFPNPFNPETWIPYVLAEPGEVVLRIFDVQGHLVRRFDLGYRSAGWYASRETAMHWDGSNEAGEHVSSGVYQVELLTRETVDCQRVMLRK